MKTVEIYTTQTCPYCIAAKGLLTEAERVQLQELRKIIIDTVSVDDFDVHELRAASFYDLPGKQRPQQAA